MRTLLTVTLLALTVSVSAYAADQTDNACTNALPAILLRKGEAVDKVLKSTPLNGASVRVLGPNMAGTMDYNPLRLTITTDSDNRIVSAVCG